MAEGPQHQSRTSEDSRVPELQHLALREGSGMKSSKSSVRWPLAPTAESKRDRPAGWPGLSPNFTQMCRREPQILAGSLASPTPVLNGFTVNCYFVPGLHNFKL